MKIADVKAYPLNIPLSDDTPGPHRSHNVMVEVKTDDGLVGWGQAFAFGGCRGAVTAMINQAIRPLLVGQDATAVAPLTQQLFRTTHLAGRYGITTFAISGVEIALWDLVGKRAGMPLCDLLGGAESREVQAYASLVRYPEGDERIAGKAAEAKQIGYGMIKLHQSDTGSLQAAREAVGDDMPITADINCRWGLHEAERMAFALDEYGLYWLEEPIWPPEDYATLAALQANTGVPLAAGENACTAFQFNQMMEEGAVTFVQPSVVKVGGVSEFMKVATLAANHNVRMAPHSPYFGPGFLATLHLIAATRQASWVEKIYYSLESDVFTEPLAFANGVYTLPDGPGLGLEVDRNVLSEYLVKD